MKRSPNWLLVDHCVPYVCSRAKTPRRLGPICGPSLFIYPIVSSNFVSSAIPSSTFLVFIRSRCWPFALSLSTSSCLLFSLSPFVRELFVARSILPTSSSADYIVPRFTDAARRSLRYLCYFDSLSVRPREHSHSKAPREPTEPPLSRCFPGNE